MQWKQTRQNLILGASKCKSLSSLRTWELAHLQSRASWATAVAECIVQTRSVKSSLSPLPSILFLRPRTYRGAPTLLGLWTSCSLYVHRNDSKQCTSWVQSHSASDLNSDSLKWRKPCAPSQSVWKVKWHQHRNLSRLPSARPVCQCWSRGEFIAWWWGRRGLSIAILLC